MRLLTINGKTILALNGSIPRGNVDGVNLVSVCNGLPSSWESPVQEDTNLNIEQAFQAWKSGSLHLNIR